MTELLYNLPLEKVFEDGTIVLTYDGCIEMAKRNKDFHKYFVEYDERFLKYNKFSPKKVKIYTGQENDSTSDWVLPEKYVDFDILEYCYTKVAPYGEIYIERFVTEYYEFEKRNLIDLLRFMKFFVDSLIEQNISWGTGRGSSCASLLLYLLGVNRVDPVKYDIPLEEFFK